jgi:hypothetical protein
MCGYTRACMSKASVRGWYGCRQTSDTPEFIVRALRVRFPTADFRIDYLGVRKGLTWSVSVRWRLYGVYALGKNTLSVVIAHKTAILFF